MTRWIEELGSDARQAVRQARHEPKLVALIVLILALGIGGCTTVFAWMETVVLHPLANIPHAERLVAVETVMPDHSFHTTSYLDYRDDRDRNAVFSGLAAAALVPADIARRGEARPERAWGMLVSENYFQVLGVAPARGRLFTAADARGPGSDPYIVLGYTWWQRRFAGRGDVIGSRVEVNHQPFTVLGVAPRGFHGTTVGVRPDYYVPLMMEPLLLPLESLNYRAPGFLHMIGRLRPGVSVAAARDEMGRLAAQLAQQYPATNRDVGAAVNPIGAAHYGVQPALAPVLWFLLAAMGLVLLIGCFNIAGLLLARAQGRAHERAVRAALGAGGGRLVRQSLTEHGLLALLGGAAGLLVAAAAGGSLAALLPPGGVPLGLNSGLGARAVAFAALATLGAALWMGLVPVVAAAAADRRSGLATLAGSSRGTTSGRGANRVRTGLVAAEAMLAFTVLVTAGLLARSLHQARAADPGFATRHVLIAALDARGAGLDDAQSGAFYEQLRTRAASLPGAEAASFERWLPLGGAGNGSTRPTIAGYVKRPGEDMDIGYNTVGPDFFRTMRIPVLTGRGITAADRATAPLVCVVNRTMAERYWPGESPIGHRLNSWDRWWTVVGVVADSQFASLREAPRPFLYFPFLQDPGSEAELVVRGAGDPLALAAPVRGAVQALHPGIAVFSSSSYAEVLRASLFAESVAARLGLLLAALALLLAGIGLYGVLSFSVAQRMREMGLRMALGAQPGDVQRQVVRQGVMTVGVGIMLGLLLAGWLAQYLTGLLFGTRPLDPLTWAAAAAVLLALAVLASLGPARRATHANPNDALRCE